MYTCLQIIHKKALHTRKTQKHYTSTQKNCNDHILTTDAKLTEIIRLTSTALKQHCCLNAIDIVKCYIFHGRLQDNQSTW